MQEKGCRQQYVTRRRVLQGAALGGAALAALVPVGCVRGGKPAVAPEREPKRGGVFRRGGNIGLGGKGFRGLDPHILSGAFAGMMTLFYQRLLRLNSRTFQLEPELAERWEVPSPTEFVFTLSPGIKWQNKPPANGRRLTASDVVFSLNRLSSTEAQFINRSLIDSVETVQAIDSSTVVLKLKQPDVSTLINLAAFSAAIMAPEVVEAARDKFTTPEVAVGTGPFILKTITDVGGSAIRNPDYWKLGLPYLDEVQSQDTADDLTWWSGFLARQFETIYRVPAAEAEKVYAERQNKPYLVAWFQDMTIQGIQANTRVKPFDDSRVTKALRLLVDHDEAVTVIASFLGRGYRTSVLPSTLADWDFSEAEYPLKFLEFKRPKDEAVKAALDLLNAAGFTRDNPLRFTITTSPTGTGAQHSTEALQAQFRRFSQGAVQTEIRVLEQAVIQGALARGNFEYVLTDLVALMPFEPDSWLRSFYHSTGSRNYGKWSNPRADQLIDNQRTIFNVEQRKVAVKAALAYLTEHAPYTAWAGGFTLNAWRPYVQDWAPEAPSAQWGYQYESVWLDT